MTNVRSRRWLAALLAASLCAQPALATEMAAMRPANLQPAPNTDEAGMWYEASRAETSLRGSADVIADPALNTYVRGVMCRVATEYCGELRLYLLARPTFNASMAPNGYAEVWSGLLLRATNEAELAYSLGHEAGHFGMNHTIERFRAYKNQQNARLALQIGLLIVGAAVAVNTGSASVANDVMNTTGRLMDLTYLASIAAYFSFSREQELSADAAGFQRMTAAGYDPHAPAAMWRERLSETQASDFPRVRSAESRISIFNSHPVTADRAAALDRLAEGRPAGEVGRERYRAAIRPFLAAWLRDDLRRRDFGQTLHVIDGLAASGEDLGVLSFFRGECYRLRRADGDDALAIAAYTEAGRHADAPADAWRALGDLHARLQHVAEAREAYETYLRRAPAAEDRWLVESSLRRLPS